MSTNSALFWQYHNIKEADIGSKQKIIIGSNEKKANGTANFFDERRSCPFIRIQVKRVGHLKGKPSGMQ